MKHEWKDRGLVGQSTYEYRDREWVKVRKPLVVCVRCGLSDRMAEHMGWTECNPVPDRRAS